MAQQLAESLPRGRQELTHHDGIKIRVFETPERTSLAAAIRIIDVANYNPLAAITFATGETMKPVYEELAGLAHILNISFAGITAFHLDEYWPSEPDNPFSFRNFLRKRVFGPLRIPADNIHEIDGSAVDLQEEARLYDEALKRGVDLAILGIGPGGHIGFNERGTPFDSRTHVANLAQDTIERDHERGEYVSDKALTQGIETILEADQIILVAYGEEKGRYLAEALYGEISENCPASALREVGHKVTIFVDQEAANVIMQARDWKIQESID